MATARVAPLVAFGIILLLAVVAGAANNNAKKPKPPAPPPKRVSCEYKKLYPYCQNNMYCPSSCPRNCHVDCATCKPICACNEPGAVCYDPRFIGGDGITFYFHGRKDQDFALLTDSNLHINAHFIGKRDPTMTRDFTWVQAVGILFDDHRLSVGALKTAEWDDALDRLAVTFDGEEVRLPEDEGARWQPDSAPALSIVRSGSANAVTVEVKGRFKISANVVPITEEDSRVHNYGVTKEDCLAHLELGFKFYSLTAEVDGVLGQTYRHDYVSRMDVRKPMPVMGGADKYFVSHLLATDCAVRRFGRGTGSLAVAGENETGDVQCSSRFGLGGSGIVCKK